MDISAAWIDRQFQAAIGKCRLTSEYDSNYNCIAFAAGDRSRWWSHLPGYYWSVDRGPNIGSLIAVFRHLGFEKQESNDKTIFESGCEKIALYEKDGMWMHAGR